MADIIIEIWQNSDALISWVPIMIISGYALSNVHEIITTKRKESINKWTTQ